MTPKGRQDLSAVIAEMRRASDLVDDANGLSDYQPRLIALALIARHFLREYAALLLADHEPQEEPPRLSGLLRDSRVVNDKLDGDGWPRRKLALLVAEAHPQDQEKKEVTTRMDRLSTSSDASRTAAPDVAEGERPITPTQVSNEVHFHSARCYGMGPGDTEVLICGGKDRKW